MILIDDIGWITCQEMTDVFEGFTTHGDAGIDGAGSDVGGEYDVLQSVEGFCDVRFVFGIRVRGPGRFCRSSTFFYH